MARLTACACQQSYLGDLLPACLLTAPGGPPESADSWLNSENRRWQGKQSVLYIRAGVADQRATQLEVAFQLLNTVGVL